MDYIGFFSGGGIKGLAYIGCIKALEERGIFCRRCAGVSIGAIFGSLLIAGYSVSELLKIVYNTNFNNLLISNNIIDTVKNFGKNKTKNLELFLFNLLQQKGIRTFKDVYFNGDYKLKIVATNLNKMKKIIFPTDLDSYDINLNNFLISKAAIMSSTLPGLLEPLKLNGNIIVDGGVKEVIPNVYFNDFLPKIYFTFKDFRPKDGYVIKINLPKIKTTNFDIDVDTKKMIIKCGYETTRKFINEYFLS